jgi:hypothetical protein
VPLARAWCLFELFVAMKSDCKVSMCFGTEDAAALHAAITKGDFSAERIIGDIDAAGAGAMKQSDKDLIMALIAEQVGIEQFNANMQAYFKTAMKGAAVALQSRRRLRT